MVMTYNICSGRNMDRVLDIGFSRAVIAGEAPDFVGLNEVRMRTEDVGFAEQARQLGEGLHYFWSFGKSVEFSGGDYGNAFLSRHPIVETSVHHIPDIGEEERIEYFEHRTALRNVIDVNGTKIAVFTSHFGLCPGERREAVAEVVRLIDAEELPMIFVGDFNASPDDPVLAPLYARLQDVSEGRKEPLTFSSRIPEIKIDYIFVSRHFTVGRVWTIDTEASDHRPLLAEVTL